MNLERLAELINAKWPCQHKTKDDMLWLWDGPWEGDGIDFCAHLSDIENSTFIIWCLDRLEELGKTAVLWPSRSGNQWSYQIIFTECDDEDPTRFVDASTRAEACALALLQALEGE